MSDASNPQTWTHKHDRKGADSTQEQSGERDNRQQDKDRDRSDRVREGLAGGTGRARNDRATPKAKPKGKGGPAQGQDRKQRPVARDASVKPAADSSRGTPDRGGDSDHSLKFRAAVDPKAANANQASRGKEEQRSAATAPTPDSSTAITQGQGRTRGQTRRERRGRMHRQPGGRKG